MDNVNEQDLNKIIIVGGGTAGWLTAHLTKTLLPFSHVVLIESPTIGILGAGEGSTPALIDFLNFVNLPISDILMKSGGTIKNGLKFTGWNTDGGAKDEYYYHNFAANPVTPISTRPYVDLFDSQLLLSLEQKIPSYERDLMGILNENNKTPFYFGSSYSRYDTPESLMDTAGSYALHFDAVKLADALKIYGKDRGIHHIEADVVDFEFKDSGDISKVFFKTEDDLEVTHFLDSDFVFDCSGFNRLILGKVYGSKWVSFSEFLSTDKALPFFIPMDLNKDIETYTECVSMNYGWMWKIPLQDRYGCGYVYDSSLTTEENVIEEIEKYLGFVPEYPRGNKGSFIFNPGYYETSWVNNCVGIGLSASFMEPLEATSISASIASLYQVFYDISNMVNTSQETRDKYNNYVKELNEEILDFVYLHYINKRNDTNFWKKFNDLTKAPKPLQNKLKLWKNSVSSYTDLLTNKMFKFSSWITVGFDTGNISYEVIAETVKRNYIHQRFYQQLFGSRRRLKKTPQICFTQRELINEFLHVNHD
jgi:tryptophan halogenase